MAEASSIERRRARTFAGMFCSLSIATFTLGFFNATDEDIIITHLDYILYPQSGLVKLLFAAILSNTTSVIEKNNITAA